jgi:hypothetical protein
MNMSNILSFEFEELPLVIANGIPAGLINGCAEIQYDRSGYWEIDSVSVEGHQTLTQEERDAGKRPWVYVAVPMDLEVMITMRLDGAEWSGKIQDAINEQLASDREDAAEARADMRRDALMGL